MLPIITTAANRAGRFVRRAYPMSTLFALLALCGCIAPEPDSGVDNAGTSGSITIDPAMPPVTEGDWLRLPADATWQWQIQPDANGLINTGYDVDVYDIDLFDVQAEVIDRLHADGRVVIAYFSAGTYESFRDDAGE